MSEQTFYSDGNVHITNTRAKLGPKTYAMANITSVTVWKVPAKRTWAIVTVFVSLLILACAGCTGLGVLGSSGSDVVSSLLLAGGVGFLGLLVLAVGIILYTGAKDTYTVRLGSASGETDALSSKDRAYIQKLVDALNQAIIYRG